MKYRHWTLNLSFLLLTASITSSKYRSLVAEVSVSGSEGSVRGDSSMGAMLKWNHYSLKKLNHSSLAVIQICIVAPTNIIICLMSWLHDMDQDIHAAIGSDLICYGSRSADLHVTLNWFIELYITFLTCNELARFWIHLMLQWHHHIWYAQSTDLGVTLSLIPYWEILRFVWLFDATRGLVRMRIYFHFAPNPLQMIPLCFALCIR